MVRLSRRHAALDHSFYNSRYRISRNLLSQFPSFCSISFRYRGNQWTAARSLATRTWDCENPEISASLKNLTSLDLSGTQVTDISELRELKNLTSLNLSRTRATDVSALRELKNLTSLDLSGTKVMSISALGDLKNLRLLNLNGTQVTDVSALWELKNVTLWYRQHVDPPSRGPALRTVA